jgi:phosphate transport system substrate-binding protein
MHAWLGDVNASRYAEICRAVRSDGVYDESRPANDLVRELQTYPTVFGVLTYDLFDRNRTNLAAAAVNGVAPTQETLADGTYPASRTLYLYVQRMRTTRGLQELVESYLQVPQIARVLVPLDEAKRREMQVKAAELGGRR